MDISISTVSFLALAAGLPGFWATRGHGLWDVAKALVLMPFGVLLSGAFCVFLVNLHVPGDDFLTPPDGAVMAILALFWATGFLSLFVKK